MVLAGMTKYALCAAVAVLLLCQLFLPACFAVELTFELPDNAKQCFMEDIDKDVSSTVEFQVVTGGQYDVDMELTAPNKKVLYKDMKKQYDTFNWKTDMTGTYTVCFSNEFSTFTHKLVYVDWQVGDEPPLIPDLQNEATAMTSLQSSMSHMHESLKVVVDYQTHHRLREAKGRVRAEDLNVRVFYWSIMESVIILAVGVGQVLVLRNFFTEKRTSNHI